jgi:ribosomal protein S18 acetylase RimI-like enzyme
LAIEVRDLPPDEMNAAVGLLSRGMRDNPLNVAAYGSNAERRQRALEGMFATLFRVFRTQRPLCALDGETLVAVGGVAPAGTCQATARQRLRFLPGMVSVGLPSARRVSRWLAAWGERDPARAHSHLGPVAVEPALRGRGIGSELMREHTRRLDETAQLGYLETDRRENVTFYERHGYVVVDEAEVIGVPNWFMSREPRRAGA